MIALSHDPKLVNIYTCEIPANDETRLEIEKVISSWEVFSREKTLSAENEAAKNTFSDAWHVNRVVFERVHRKRAFKKFKLYLCYNEELIVKGFAFLRLYEQSSFDRSEKKKIFLHLRFLSVDPEDLLKDKCRPRVGSSLVRSLFERCIDSNYEGILVKPLRLAEPFFEKLGFRFLVNEEFPNTSMIWRTRQIESK